MSRAGFTLIELVVSLSIMSILLVAMGSAVLLAGHAVPEAGNPGQTIIDGWTLTEAVASELSYAVHLGERTGRAVTFTVADRDGDGAPETIRYAWSGTAGEPLVRSQNGGAAVNVAASIERFAIDYRLQERRRAPRVLLVVPDAAAPGADDQARVALMRSWGYVVVPISADAAAIEFASAAARADVAYVSEEVASAAVGTKLRDLFIGVAIEQRALSDEMGLSASAGGYTESRIEIPSNAHEIVAPFDTGRLSIVTGNEPLNRMAGLPAPGLVSLAYQLDTSATSLGIIEAGGTLYDGAAAAGRRIFLPWGGDGFVVERLDANGQVLLQRVLEWAAGPSVLTGVHLTVQTAAYPSSRLETEVRIFNEPGVPGP